MTPKTHSWIRYRGSRETKRFSAERIRSKLITRFGVSLGVVVTDTFGRAWRRGLVNVAIGCAGMAALVDLRGTRDATGTGNPLVLTIDNNKTITANFTKRPRLTMPDCFGRMGGDGFRVLLNGEIGGRYSIEKSSDLQRWSAVALVTNALRVIQIDAAHSANAPREFYRAVAAP